MNKILIAIDGSESALRAVDYVGRNFGGAADLKVCVLYVLPGVPAELWDDGHILLRHEKEARQQVVDKWVANQKTGLPALFQPALDRLSAAGIGPGQVETKSVIEDTDVADAVLNEAEAGHFQTLVLGRRGLNPVERFLTGSVATKVINHASKLAVCVVA